MREVREDLLVNATAPYDSEPRNDRTRPDSSGPRCSLPTRIPCSISTFCLTFRSSKPASDLLRFILQSQTAQIKQNTATPSFKFAYEFEQVFQVDQSMLMNSLSGYLKSVDGCDKNRQVVQFALAAVGIACADNVCICRRLMRRSKSRS